MAEIRLPLRETWRIYLVPSVFEVLRVAVSSDEGVRTMPRMPEIVGETQDVVPAVAAMAEADISFKLLMGVRNKVIEAYKQTMNMQI